MIQFIAILGAVFQLCVNIGIVVLFLMFLLTFSNELIPFLSTHMEWCIITGITIFIGGLIKMK